MLTCEKICRVGQNNIYYVIRFKIKQSKYFFVLLSGININKMLEKPSKFNNYKQSSRLIVDDIMLSLEKKNYLLPQRSY